MSLSPTFDGPLKVFVWVLPPATGSEVRRQPMVLVCGFDWFQGLRSYGLFLCVKTRAPDQPCVEFAIDLNSTFISSILGVPVAPAGKIDLPAGGALRAPPVGRPISPAGAAGTLNIDEIKVEFKSVANSTNG